MYHFVFCHVLKRYTQQKSFDFYLRFTGKLDVKVDGPTKTDLTRKDHGDKCDISFLPMTPGIYNIIVKYNGKEMKGSPFVSKVSGIQLLHKILKLPVPLQQRIASANNTNIRYFILQGDVFKETYSYLCFRQQDLLYHSCNKFD